LAFHLHVVLGLIYIGFGQKVEAMLKVTIKQADSAETWELEGKLSGDWVKELERCWKERSSPAGVSLHVQLKAVSYIDAAGKQLLTEMHGRGVEIRGCGCMTKAVVEEITRHASAN
jgi:ABC-type transporter Mla MlaB component